MNFADFITKEATLIEAEKTIDTKAKATGTSAGDLLKAVHDKFGSGQFVPKSYLELKPQFTKDFGKHSDFLINNGYLQKNGPKFTITQLGLDWANANSSGSSATTDVEPDTDLAKGVRDITLLKQKKFIVPKVGANSKYLDQMKKIMNHMIGFADGTVKTTYMLAGDPGTGKTSFIKSLSTLTGIPLVIIEAPHITQEHLINIPFLVIDGPKTRNGNLTIDDSDKQMKVVQAESNLVTQLRNKVKHPPEQIQREINKNKILRDIQPLLASRINQISNSYNSILFLDEFYRTSSMKIRNVLRNILNGKIGNDKIPKGVYIIMATNINDEGVEDIPLNQDFHLMDYDVSSKEDFMAYMYGKYVTNPDDTDNSTKDTEQNSDETKEEAQVSVKPEVWNKFMGELTDADLGFNDEDADVRLSPRRLEQMIISIDALLPVNNEKEALLLLAFIKNNLSNYIDEKGSNILLNKFYKIALDLIAEMAPSEANIRIEKLLETPIKKSEWRDQLQTEIELKIKLGENRKYVPVVSGQPGIGKTTEMGTISRNLGMGFIQADVSNLTPEDITGMPIAKMGGETITTEFSEPNLYITIMKEYNEQIELFRQPGRKFNMILLFDEMNRASVPVFNAIRKVLLEKEFEHVKLPDDIIVTGAINPTDIGAIEFTSHTRDVLDIIPSSGNFSKTFDYIKGKNELMKISESMGFDLHGSVANILQQLALEFKSTMDNENNPIEDVDVQPFWWNDGASTFYVSPREMTEAVSNATLQIKNSFVFDMNWDIDKSYTEEEYQQFIDEAVNVTAKSFVDSFNMITLKQEIQDFTKLLGMKILGNEKFKKIFEVIRTKKSANTMSLVQILKNADGDVSFLDKSVIGSYINDFSSTEMVQDIQDITDNYIKDMPGKESIEKILALFDRVNKSLEKLNASNNYADQLRKYIGGKLVGIMKSDSINILDIVEDDALMTRLSAL